ncbi:MAG: type II toxin-antitoxin system MqsA family antitoxin [Spirochaetales bacterium]|nr:type II toxin-antitoxin system MqsA family antitoxin [Spirochaetales bacterium]
MISCVICKEGIYKDGSTTVTLERESTIIVVKAVPAMVCTNCGKYILSEEVTEYLMKLLDQAVLHGAAFEMLNYAA